MRHLASPRSATLFEQAVISGTGFLSMLFFARHMSTLDWATFSFASGFMLVALGLQLSVVTLPMLSFSRGEPLSASEQSHWSWLNRAALACAVGLSLGVGGVLSAAHAGWAGDSFVCAAVLIPPAFSYEYLRRRLILAREFRRLARSAVAYALGVAMGVAANHVFSGPPLMAAFSFWPGMLLAVAVSGVREPWRWAAPPAPWFAPLKTFAPAAAGSSLAASGYGFAVQAILGAVSGSSAVALFNATRIVIQPINTMIAAFNNLDLPGAAKAYSHGGAALLKFQRHAVLRLVLVGGPYLVALCLLASPLLNLLFAGRYSSEAMVWAWSLVGFLMLVATPTENVFYVTRKTHLLLLSRIAAAGVGCLCAFALIPSMAAVGAVLSVVAGWLIALGGGVVALWATRQRQSGLDAA